LKSQLTTALVTSGLDGQPVIVMESLAAEYSTWDTCVIGDQVDGAHQYHSFKAGRKSRNESYIQHVHFRVIRGGSESTAARTAAFAHLAELEDLIADDPKIGLAEPTLILQVAGFQCNTTQEAGSAGWLANLRADISVNVRLV